MDIVSFKTANRLKAAGFPQPEETEVCTANFWYKEDGDLICYGHTCDSWGEPEYFSHSIFAPTPADILRHFEDATLFYNCRTERFKCSAASNALGIAWFDVEHENPAEAAALSWIEINETK